MKPVFHNRNQDIQITVHEKPARIDQGRLSHECVKLDPVVETDLTSYLMNVFVVVEKSVSGRDMRQQLLGSIEQ